MRPVSAKWMDAIRQSHTFAVRATVLRDAEEEREIEEVTAGGVTLDAKAATRGRCDLTVVGTPELVPILATDLLAPYGNEIKLERGIDYLDGTDPEYASLGVFRIEDADIEDQGDRLEVRINGLDRSAGIIDARFEEPYKVPSGTNIADAIKAVIEEARAGLTYDFAEITSETSGLVVEEGEDRWAFAQGMATSVGCDLYFDGDGTLVLRPVPTPDDVADPYLLVEGEEGVLVTASRSWVRGGTFNRVIARGENTSEATVARGVATDDNPESPTYYYGRFGPVPRFYSSPFIKTDAQAEDAAQGILTRELGTSQTVSFGAIVDPALEPGDVVRITRERSGIDESNVIDQIIVPLGEGAMTGQTRATIR